MTAACGGGPSDRRPGVSDAFLITVGGAADIIGNAGGIGYALLAAAIGTYAYDVIASCPTDPPGFTALTLDEVNALALKQILLPEFSSGVTKLKNIIDTALWYVNCQCTSAPQPHQPAVPALPAGTPVDPVSGNGACSDLSWQGTPVAGNVISGGLDDVPFLDITPQLWPFPGPVTTCTISGGSSGTIPCYPINASTPPTSGRFRMQLAAGGREVEAFLWAGNPSCVGTVGSGVAFNNPTSVTSVDTGKFTIPTTVSCGSLGTQPVTHIAVATNGNATGGPLPDTTVELLLYGNCGQGSNSCCAAPTQPDVSGILDQILALLSQVGKPVQAYGSLLTGAVTTGLTGAGTLAATGAIGVRIDLTTVPHSLGLEIGNPDALFDAGWITPLTTQGPTQSERIRYATQVFFFPPTVQSFDYFLHAGVAASATLLDGAP